MYVFTDRLGYDEIAKLLSWQCIQKLYRCNMFPETGIYRALKGFFLQVVKVYDMSW